MTTLDPDLVIKRSYEELKRIYEYLKNAQVDEAEIITLIAMRNICDYYNWIDKIEKDK